MFHCPKCRHAAHARTSRYLSENTKERYHQCTNIHCSCTFVTLESVERFIIRSTGKEPLSSHPEESCQKKMWL